MINGGQRYLMVLIPMYQIGFITGQSSGLESLPQAKSKKPEIAALQAVCDVVIAAPPKLMFTTLYHNRSKFWPDRAKIWQCH